MVSDHGSGPQFQFVLGRNLHNEVKPDLVRYSISWNIMLYQIGRWLFPVVPSSLIRSKEFEPFAASRPQRAPAVALPNWCGNLCHCAILCHTVPYCATSARGIPSQHHLKHQASTYLGFNGDITNGNVMGFWGSNGNIIPKPWNIPHRWWMWAMKSRIGGTKWGIGLVPVDSTKHSVAAEADTSASFGT